MNSEPPIADPRSTAASKQQKQRVPRASGAALVALLMLGCFAIACGIGILGSVIINGITPLLSHSVPVIDPWAVVGTFFIAILGVLCCVCGVYILRHVSGTQR